MPAGTPDLAALVKKLQEVTANIPHLQLTTNQVSVFLPADLLSGGLGEELCVSVSLFKRTQRTTAVFQVLAEHLRDTIAGFARRHIPQCRLVEVSIFPFDPEVDGFANAELKKP
jgi:hypothetical protein